MVSDPDTFFVDFVARAYRDWDASREDAYLAKTLVHQLNVMAERAFHGWKRTPERILGANDVSAFRDRLAAIHGDVGLIRDIDDAHKHFKLGRRSRSLTSAEQTGLEALSYGEGGFGEGPYGGTECLVVCLDNGDKRALSSVIESVFQMWRDLLAEGAGG